MKVQYIAGRPLKISGEKVEVGTRLSAKQIDAIPHLEALVSGRFIFQVISDKDIQRLPNYVRGAYHLKSKDQVNAALAKPSDYYGGNTAAQEAAENHKQVRQIQVAEKQMRVQDETYDRLNGVTLPEAPKPAEEENALDDAPKDVEETSETPAEGDATFDPAEHSVAVVKEYLEAHPEEKDAVLAAEADGKARKGLLEA